MAAPYGRCAQLVVISYSAAILHIIYTVLNHDCHRNTITLTLIVSDRLMVIYKQDKKKKKLLNFLTYAKFKQGLTH